MNDSDSDATDSKQVVIVDGKAALPGTITLPPWARGIVLFAHGSGSSRLSPRNQQVARALNEAGLGTLLFDLLTEDEALDRSHVFDIPLLARRLATATRWLREQRPYAHLKVGYFGASTGAAAALVAAAEPGAQISAVVSRGGRPDLARSCLARVSAPTLLIVGGNDEPVIQMNQEALEQLPNGTLEIIPGATHLFEEPGKLEQVSEEATDWFLKHLPRRAEKETRHVAAG